MFAKMPPCYALSYAYVRCIKEVHQWRGNGTVITLEFSSTILLGDFQDNIGTTYSYSGLSPSPTL